MHADEDTQAHWLVVARSVRGPTAAVAQYHKKWEPILQTANCCNPLQQETVSSFDAPGERRKQPAFKRTG